MGNNKDNKKYEAIEIYYKNIQFPHKIMLFFYTNNFINGNSLNSPTTDTQNEVIDQTQNPTFYNFCVLCFS